MSNKYEPINANLRPFTASGGSVLPPKTILGVNQFLQSPSGRFKLVAHEDRNLVLYEDSRVVWVANDQPGYWDQFYPQVWKKDDVSATYIAHKLVVFDVEHRRVWNSLNTDIPNGGTEANAAGRTYLQLQDDGNLVIVDAFPLWEITASVSIKPEVPAAIIRPNTMIYPGDSFRVGKSRLDFQADGNLVFYGENDRVIWHSNTYNKGAVFAAMQDDGNLAIRNADQVILWHTATHGNPGAYARIQEDGSFSIVNDRVCWARYGFTPSIKPVRTISYGGNPYKDGLPTYDRVIWTF